MAFEWVNACWLCRCVSVQIDRQAAILCHIMLHCTILYYTTLSPHSLQYITIRIRTRTRTRSFHFLYRLSFTFNSHSQKKSNLLPLTISSSLILTLYSPHKKPEIDTYLLICVKYHSIYSQYNTLQHNTTQHNTTQYNTTHYNTTQHNTIQYNTTHYNTSSHLINSTHHLKTYLQFPVYH